MITVEDVFKAFDGAQATAALLGVSVQAVSNMKTRGAIPPRHWSRLVTAARERGKEGITFDVLAGIEARHKARAA